jgi:hypothetical protein
VVAGVDRLHGSNVGGVLAQPRVRAARGGGFVLLLAAVGIAAVVMLAGNIFGFFDFGFGSKTIDRSQPPLLLELTDLSEYHASSANFSEIIDLEKDTKYLPDFIAGQRALMVAAGTVDATVDFSGLTDDKVVVSEDRKSVTITLPPPALSEVTLDHDRTYVESRNRGLFDRVGGMFSGNPIDDQALYQAAETKLHDAAEASELKALAEKNTRAMLETLLTSLGFENITVEFDHPPQPQ